LSTYNPNNYELPPSQSSKSGLSVSAIISIILVCILGAMLVCSGLFNAFVYPTLVRNRDIAQRSKCSNNLNQIAIAIQNYESAYKQLPPAYTVDAEGKRLHSWRTLILPFVGEQTLYRRIDLSKPWDDPANAFLQEVDISVYRCPSSKIAPGMTTYQAMEDSRNAFPGTAPQKIDNITDGLSNTILLFESDGAEAVHWAEPKDQSMASFLSASQLQAKVNNSSLPVKPSHRSGRNVVMVDGSTQFVPNGTKQEVLEGLATCYGGESVERNNK
jgi:Protein of unknown function (DUF1559)